jgi:hypothetical protein
MRLGGEMMLDIRRALEYIGEDPRASEKLGLGALVSLAPILNLAAVGYEVEVARRVAQGQPRPLPEWNDLRRLWVQGAGLGLAYFVYGLPMLLIVFSGMTVVFVGIVFSIQSESARSGAGPQTPAAVLGIFLALFAVAFVYGLIFGLLRPAILAEYAQRGTFRACFDFGAMWRFIRRDPGDYLLLWLAEQALGWIISLPLFFVVFAVGFIPFAGPLAVALIAAGVGFFLILFNGHLVGQLLRARSSPST